MCDEDKEYEKRVNLYYDDYNEYLVEIMKEVIPRQLANLYKYDLIIDETLNQYVNSVCDLFTFGIDFNCIRKDVEETLKIKYNLVITCDEPLKMKPYK